MLGKAIPFGERLKRFRTTDLFTDVFVFEELTQVPEPLIQVMLLERDPKLARVINEGRMQAQQEVTILDHVLATKELFM